MTGRLRALAAASGCFIFFFDAAAVAAAATSGDCEETALLLRGDWGSAAFTVRIADDFAERARGLMYAESLPRGEGMLFLYDRPQPVSFWMKNTLVPLDLLFMDETGRVVRVHENAAPGDTTSIPSGAEVVAVLEINGGLAAQYGVTTGSFAEHPFFDGDETTWPCAVE